MAEDASTADATRIPKLDASRIQWRDATSAKGRKFQIGTLKPDDSTEVQESIVGNRAEVGVMDTVTHELDDILWPVGDSNWKTPDQRVIDIVDISSYCLTKNHFSYYNYILYINCTNHWDYTFYDETGDYYSLSTYTSGEHHVAYDSDKPNIVKIVATS